MSSWMGFWEREKGTFFLGFISPRSSNEVSVPHKQFSSIYVNERNDYWRDCKEFIKAQSEQLNAWSGTQDVISAHTSHCTPEQPRTHLWLITPCSAVTTSDPGTLATGIRKLCPRECHLLSRLWKISIKIKGRGGTSARTVLLHLLQSKLELLLPVFKGVCSSVSKFLSVSLKSRVLSRGL